MIVENLELAAEIIRQTNIEKLWKKYAKPYKVVRYTSDQEIEILSESKNNARCVGLYSYKCAGVRVYVGLTICMTVDGRITRHGGAFKNEHNKSESTGKRIRQHMKDHNLDEMIMEIEFIDLSHIPETISVLEQKSIDYFKPMFNKQFK